jgi:hypothetical protein
VSLCEDDRLGNYGAVHMANFLSDVQNMQEAGVVDKER